MGTIAHSISITSDAFNNLSDSASCVVTLFGYKLAAKPADKDHPFGHGRIEYLTSLVLGVGHSDRRFELLKSSVMKVIHPETVRFSWVVLISLLASIGVKFWMCGFNRKLGRRIDSSVMLATAQDSLNDVIATAATVVSLVLSAFGQLAGRWNYGRGRFDIRPVFRLRHNKRYDRRAVRAAGR